MIDLHTHTICSDGTDTPRELVNKALSQGLNVLAITDHDTTSGWNEARQALRGDLELVLGAEISCLTTDGISVHMLALLFNGEHKEMQIMLEEKADTSSVEALETRKAENTNLIGIEYFVRRTRNDNYTHLRHE